MAEQSDAKKHETLKQKLMDALRKTGHVSEEALEAVATVAIATTTGIHPE